MTDNRLLLLSTCLIAVAFVLPLAMARLSILARAGIRLLLLAALTHIVFRLVGSPLRPVFHQEAPSLALWEQLVVAGWWALAAHSAVLFARVVVALQERSREAQIVVDLVAAAIYLAAGFGIITFVFAVPLGGLLATSGILAIVLGLALQSTLSDVFSGIAVGIERPFRAGDLIWVDGGVEGTVLQVNWRSTHIATGPDHITVIPNSVIAKARVVNHSRPTVKRMDKVEVRLDPEAAASRCIAALTAAALACRIPLDEPRPMVVQKSLEGDGASYEIYFAVADSDALSSAKTELYGQVQRHLRHDGISLAVRGLPRPAAIPVPDVADLLTESDLFGSVPEEGRSVLARHFREVEFAAGEPLIAQGGDPDALFILASGAVEITREEGRGRSVLHRMSPGGALGAIGLVTGTPYAASAIAMTPVRAHRLDQDGFSNAVAMRPELSQELEAMARRGQAAVASDAAASEDHQQERPEWLLSRIRRFIDRLSVVPAEY